MKFILIFNFYFIFFSFFSQKDYEKFNLGLRFNRLDFFIEPSVHFQKVKVKHEFGLGFGVNRSVFQKRLFPELNYSLSSNYTMFKNFFYQGISSYHLSFYNPNRANQEFHFFNEVLVGLQLGLGKRFKTYFQPEIGLQTETFHSDFLNKTKSYFTFGYSAKFGFSYAF